MSLFPITKFPLTKSSLILWLNSKDNSTITSSGGLVSLWRDKSGIGNDAAQVTIGSQPSIGVNTLGGFPAISFSGSSRFLSGTLSGFSGLPYSIFTVGQRRSSGIYNYFFSNNQTVSVNLGWRTDTVLYHQTFGGGNNTASAIATSAYTTPTPVIIAGTQSASTRTLYFNSSTAAVNEAYTNTNTGMTQYALGYFGSGGGYANIDLGEVLVFNRVLSASEITEIIRYLSKEWGITIS